MSVEVTQAIRQLATLRGAVRPVVAGVKINFPGFLCSLGFSASRSGIRGVVTASHCTNTQGGGSINGKTVFVFSPLANIKGELGALTTH